MDMQLRVLHCGSCETLKTGVHATALGLFAVMALYNTAAWLCRRERHLAVNAVLYGALTVWERTHVAHHLAALRDHEPPAVPRPTGPAPVIRGLAA